MTFGVDYNFNNGAESMILSAPPAESMILSARLLLLLPSSMLPLPLLSSLQSLLLLLMSNLLPLPLLPLPPPSLPHFLLQLLVDCCLAPLAESMILSVPPAESIILSALCWEYDALSMQWEYNALSAALDTRHTAQEARRIEARAASTAVAAFSAAGFSW
jgi:hypothetical protein